MKECDEGRLHPLQFATRMAVMVFVRATCSRSGSAAPDWFDRAGKMLHRIERKPQRAQYREARAASPAADADAEIISGSRSVEPP